VFCYFLAIQSRLADHVSLKKVFNKAHNCSLPIYIIVNRSKKISACASFAIYFPYFGITIIKTHRSYLKTLSLLDGRDSDDFSGMLFLFQTINEELSEVELGNGSSG
jgi:hypothetical protein